jgi:M6 family metalloprotease-like protein
MRRISISRNRIRAALALGAAALAAWAAMPGSVPGETRTGTLNVVWQTRGVENALASVNLFLVDAKGAATELQATPADLAPFGGMLRLNGRRISVTGDLSPAGGGRVVPLLRVQTIQPLDGPMMSVSYGNQQGTRSYVTLLCRFPDKAAADPHPASVYEQWMGPAYPGLEHYWRESSEDRVDVTTRVVGPFVLPRASTEYLNSSGTANLGMLIQDCTGAADAAVDFTPYAGINMQFNSALDNASWGGSWNLTIDGQTRRFGATWMANWATQSTYAHETGHSLGLPHSSGPYSATYDSRWDVMSGGGSNDAGTRVAPHTIAFHKDLLGWIPAARKYVLSQPGTATLNLVRDAVPTASGYQMVQIAVGTGGSGFYTVEARRYAGYDAQGRIPGEAVVIHRVNLNDETPAKVVDPDNNGNPNDAGAMWVPGETFLDLQNGVRVSVLAATADGFTVEVSTQGNVTVTSDAVLAPGTLGAPYAFQLAAVNAEAGIWSVSAGQLPKGLNLVSTGRIEGTPTKAGSYAFTVLVSTPGGFGKRDVRLDVTEPQLAQEAVLDGLLGTGTLSADERSYLDLQGNANGHLDVGDVRAWLIARNLPAGQ